MTDERRCSCAITDEMVEAGVEALTKCVGALEWPSTSAEETVISVFLAMANEIDGRFCGCNKEFQQDNFCVFFDCICLQP